MEQHAVPQPITSYEFRLVGDMTLKQFGKLAAGVILALIVYGINPAPAILKWTLIAIFTGLGAGMAFLPFQGRPLDTWIISFFKRIYSPTQYVWQMGGQLKIQPSYEEVIDNIATNQQKPAKSQVITNFQPPTIKTQSINSDQQLSINNKQQNSLIGTEKAFISDLKVPPQVIPSETELWHEGKSLKPSEPIPKNQTEEIPTILYDSPLPTNLPTEALATANQPPLDQLSVGKTTIYSADSQNSPDTVHRTLDTNTRPTVSPLFNPSLIIPTLPKIPNIFGGFVKNTEGKLVEGAIIEVRDSSLNPVRAFKTNKLGQFQIATPLPNGTYEIETEKDGLTFDIIKIEIKGEILPPFEIIAKAA